MIVVFPDYKFYSARTGMQRATIDNYVKSLDKKIISKCNTVKTFLEDKLADELLNNYQDCVTAVAKSEFQYLQFDSTLNVEFPNRFYDRYNYTDDIAEDYVNKIKTVSLSAVGDKDKYLLKRKQVFFDRMKYASREYVVKEKVALVFLGNTQVNRFQKIEPEVGDGLFLIYADMNSCITSYYYGGIYLNELEALMLLEGSNAKE